MRRFTVIPTDYLDAEGRAAHFGYDAVRWSLAKSEDSMRTTRNVVVKLMADLYDLGQNPLSPLKEVDRDVSRILDEPPLTPAARALAGMSPQGTTINKDQASPSNCANAISSKKKAPQLTARNEDQAGPSAANASLSKNMKDKYKAAAARRPTTKFMTRASNVRLEVTPIKSANCTQARRVVSTGSQARQPMSRGAVARDRAAAAWDARARPTTKFMTRASNVRLEVTPIKSANCTQGWRVVSTGSQARWPMSRGAVARDGAAAAWDARARSLEEKIKELKKGGVDC